MQVIANIGLGEVSDGGSGAAQAKASKNLLGGALAGLGQGRQHGGLDEAVLVGLALLVVEDDEAVLAGAVLLAVLELVVDFELVALCFWGGLFVSALTLPEDVIRK